MHYSYHSTESLSFLLPKHSPIVNTLKYGVYDAAVISHSHGGGLISHGLREDNRLT